MSKKIDFDGPSKDLAGLSSILKEVAAAQKQSNTNFTSDHRHNQIENRNIAFKERPFGQSKRALSKDIATEECSNGQPLRTVLVDTAQGQSSENKNKILPSQLRPLTQYESIVYEWLKQHDEITTQYAEIAKITGISPSTLRKIIRKFKEFQWIEVSRYNKSSVQGLTIKVNLDSIEDCPQGVSERTVLIASLRDRERKTLSNSIEENQKTIFNKILDLTSVVFKDQYPFLDSIGFGTNEMKRLVRQWKQFDVDPQGIFQSLRYADWAIEHNLKDKKGNSIGTGYIFNALKRNGAYDRPPGYTSLVEKAVEEETQLENYEKQKQEEQLQKQREILCQEWISSLTAEEKENQIIIGKSKYPFLTHQDPDKLLFSLWTLNNPVN